MIIPPEVFDAFRSLAVGLFGFWVLLYGAGALDTGKKIRGALSGVATGNGISVERQSNRLHLHLLLADFLEEIALLLAMVSFVFGALWPERWLIAFCAIAVGLAGTLLAWVWKSIVRYSAHRRGEAG